ncbi:MAG TPA: NfeD family protein [Bacteroidales bacterium]|nr:NfeD family protein [Bacteroidales bacterium]
MSWIIIVSLIVIGIIFLLLEILVVPGVSLVGIVGGGLIVFAVVSAFTTYGVVEGALTLVGALFASIVAIVFALKSNSWRKAMLNAEVSGKVNVIEPNKINKGDEGVTITRLNPMGKAMIQDEYYEVTSSENLVNENTPIVVVKVDGNKIIVKPKL